MKRGTLIAAVLFAALLIGALFTMNRKPERGMAHLALTAIDKAAVDAIEITGPNPVKLVKKDGAWKIDGGRLADGPAIDRALDMLTKVESSEVVSNKADRFAEFEVTDEKGTHLRLSAGGKKLADVVLGKAGKGSAFVRQGNDVFEVAKFSPGFLVRPASGWQMLKLFSDTLDDVTRIEVAVKGVPSYALVKEEAKWKLEDPKLVPAGFRFDETVARSFATTLVNATAKQILDADPGADATGLGAPDVDRVAFVGKNGTRHMLKLGNPTGDKLFYGQVEGSTDVVTLPEYANKALRRAPTDLRDLTLIKLEPAKVTALTIKQGKSLLAIEKKGAMWKVAKSSEKVPDGTDLDSSKIDQRLQALGAARAIRIATEAERANDGTAHPTATVTATLEDGKSVTLALGAQTKIDNVDVVFARGNIDGDTYVLGKWIGEQLTSGIAALKK